MLLCSTVSPTAQWVSFSCSHNLLSTPLSLLLLSHCTICSDCLHANLSEWFKDDGSFSCQKSVQAPYKWKEIHLHLCGRRGRERETETLARKYLLYSIRSFMTCISVPETHIWIVWARDEAECFWHIMHSPLTVSVQFVLHGLDYQTILHNVKVVLMTWH